MPEAFSIPKELNLLGISYGVFLDVINTVPIEPKYFTIEFHANGVRPPEYQDDEDRERYIDECTQKRLLLSLV